MQTTDRDALKEKIDGREDMTLIEVLGPESYADYHLPGAINIPAGAENFDERAQAAARKDDQVIVSCKDEECDASPRAGRRLEELGFTNVLDYEAGKEDWRAAGLPTE
ncbi:rhodanese-like domain-containing protein [Alterinioella nitratireducens]|uniref:rhodanese-like domain-containing protein n=1 Tax=Alterinioella nitratireducens TaxID=2735915 RepID=UPI0015552A2C|nr:rhodanese-like domain-containing protein [Alterinioella nitratireducens]NPD21768.1 rhodanese-like domain-containing protein [Alterinioella nitratireducens]